MMDTPMYISICDDEPRQREYLALLVHKWSCSAIVTEYPSAEAFSFARASGTRCDVLLLDIQMGGQNGVDLARELRQTDETLIIVFITALPDFISDGYDVSALHYLMKPVDETKLFRVLDQAAKRLSVTDRTLLLPVDGEILRLPYKNIICAESLGRAVEITAVNGTYTVNLPTHKIEAELAEGFVRCHRSYLIALRHIQKITKTDVFLTGGKAVPLSRRLYDTVNRALLAHVREQP